MELNGVSRRFGNVEALRPTTLRIGRGQYLVITGPSGSGKSTLLHLLGLLDRPTSGILRFEGTDVGTLDDPRRAELRGHRIGFVFQAFHLISSRTAVENVELAMMYQGVPRRERRTRALAALERVGLQSRATAFPTTLSGGEQQRVAIARAISGGAGLVLADEPTGNLDSASGRRVLDVFDELNREGLTIVVITHDPEVADRTDLRVEMRDGLVTRQPAMGSSTRVLPRPSGDG